MEAKYSRYRLVYGSPDTVACEVEKALGRGWQVYGSPFYYNNMVCQAIVYLK